MNNNTNVLEVNSICVDYAASNGTVHAVDNVSFTLKRGEVLGLAGESGSGKSTLAYAISRLLRPPALITQGEVLYYQRKSARDLNSMTQHDFKSTPQNAAESSDAIEPVDILKLTQKQLRAFRWQELAMVFQSAMNALNPVLNLEVQMTDVLKAHRPDMSKDERADRAKELLRLVGIAPDRLRSYPHELSGGMRQRSIIAIALALSPEIIIMDEPTTALDVVVQRDILTELLALKDQLGFSIIFITHDLSLLLEIADKVAIMYAGKLVETASSENLSEHALHPYTYGLLHSFPSLHGPRRKMTGIPGSPPDLRAVPPGCPFHPRCHFAFSACKTNVPTLLNTDAQMQQHVACHLYDATLNPAGPPASLAREALPNADSYDYAQGTAMIPVIRKEKLS